MEKRNKKKPMTVQHRQRRQRALRLLEEQLVTLKSVLSNKSTDSDYAKYIMNKFKDSAKFNDKVMKLIGDKESQVATLKQRI